MTKRKYSVLFLILFIFSMVLLMFEKASFYIVAQDDEQYYSDPTKYINGVADPINLSNREEVITYTITQLVPQLADTVSFTDTLEDVLEIVGEPEIDANSQYTITVEGNTITASTQDASSDRDQTVTLTILAKLREDVTDAELIERYGEERGIPNQAIVSINDQPKMTNTVLFIPPLEYPENPSKLINDSQEAQLAFRTEIFTYTISQHIPVLADIVSFTDTLEDVLEIVGEPEIDANSQYTITVEGNTITASTQDATSDRDQTVTLTIHAKLRDDVSDAELIERYGEERVIPNQAMVSSNGYGIVTNYVTVIPPNETIEINVKKVWDDLDNLDEIRPSSITVQLLADGEVTQEVEVTEETFWETRFENLPKYNGQTEIVYTINEITPEGYTAEITGDMQSGFTITNVHTLDEGGEDGGGGDSDKKDITPTITPTPSPSPSIKPTPKPTITPSPQPTIKPTPNPTASSSQERVPNTADTTYISMWAFLLTISSFGILFLMNYVFSGKK